MNIKLKIQKGFGRLGENRVDLDKQVIFVTGLNEAGKTSFLNAVKACYGYDPFPGTILDQVYQPRAKIMIEAGETIVERTRRALKPKKKTDIWRDLGLTKQAFELCMDQDAVLNAKKVAEVLSDVSVAKVDFQSVLEGHPEGKVKVLSGLSMKEALKHAVEERRFAKTVEVPKPYGELRTLPDIDPAETRRKIGEIKKEIEMAVNSISKEKFLAAKRQLEIISQELLNNQPVNKIAWELQNIKKILASISSVNECPTCGQTIPQGLESKLEKTLMETEEHLKRIKSLEMEKGDLDVLMSKYFQPGDMVEVLNVNLDSNIKKLEMYDEVIEHNRKVKAADTAIESITKSNEEAEKAWNEWDAIIKKLESVKEEELESINPLAERVAKTASIMGMDVSINGTEAKYQGRPIETASTSSQWRVKLLIFEAINHIFQFPILMIDEAGVNDLEWKKTVNKLVAAIKDDYVKVIIAATTFAGEAAPPENHPWARKLEIAEGVISKKVASV